MLTLAGIASTILGFAHYAWMLLLLFIPQVLDFMKPVWQSLWSGLAAFVNTMWNGAKKANFDVWMLILALSAIAGVVGYHYGWNSCIEWVHEHFRLITKVQPTSWWRFW